MLLQDTLVGHTCRTLFWRPRIISLTSGMAGACFLFPNGTELRERAFHGGRAKPHGTATDVILPHAVPQRDPPAHQ